MSPASEGELYCDVDALEVLKNQLESIHAALADPAEHVDVYDHRLGSHALEEAIDDFISGWRDGRKQIRDGIDAAKGKIDGAVTTYCELEAKIAAAAQGEPAS